MSQVYTNGAGSNGAGEERHEEKTEERHVENVIVIGSGPAGFTAGLYTARANLGPLLITGNEYGGQVSITYDVENYPGFPESVSGPGLVEKMKEQAEKFGTRIEFDYVTEIVTDQHPFLVRTTNGKEYATKAIILATGARPRYLGIPGEKEYTGKGVSYCGTCDGFFFRGKDVVVVGGGDSAMEEGIFLTKFANKVEVVHRRDELRAGTSLQQRAFANPKISFVWDTVIEEIQGNGVVQGIQTKNLKTGEAKKMDTDGVFIFIGHYPNSKFLVGQLAMDEEGYVITDERYRTSVPGVYAAGEIQDSHFRQIATSVGQGTGAAMELEKWLAAQE